MPCLRSRSRRVNERRNQENGGHDDSDDYSHFALSEIDWLIYGVP
jgi:hypothetical protein